MGTRIIRTIKECRLIEGQSGETQNYFCNVETEDNEEFPMLVTSAQQLNNRKRYDLQTLLRIIFEDCDPKSKICRIEVPKEVVDSNDTARLHTRNHQGAISAASSHRGKRKCDPRVDKNCPRFSRESRRT